MRACASDIRIIDSMCRTVIGMLPVACKNICINFSQCVAFSHFAHSSIRMCTKLSGGQLAFMCENTETKIKQSHTSTKHKEKVKQLGR